MSKEVMPICSNDSRELSLTKNSKHIRVLHETLLPSPVPPPACEPITVTLGGGVKTQKKRATSSTVVKAAAAMHVAMDEENQKELGATTDTYDPTNNCACA
jgi:hypothetical protein